jgi:hypothetical protein
VSDELAVIAEAPQVRELSVTVRGKKVTLREPNMKARYQEGSEIAGTLQTIEVELTDGFGLPADPLVYARPGCGECIGRGVVRARKPMTPAQAERFLTPSLRDADGKPIFSDRAKRDYAKGKWTEHQAVCRCAGRAYERAQQDAAKLRACQAKENQSTSPSASES